MNKTISDSQKMIEPSDMKQGCEVSEAGLDLHRFNCTDAGNAQMFAEVFGDRVRYDYLKKRWLIWREHWWAADDDGEVMRLGKEVACRRYMSAADMWGDGGLQEIRKKQSSWAITSESHSRIKATITLAQSEPTIADNGKGWNADPWTVGVANGVIDLRTGRLREGNPDDRITMHTDLIFDSKADCPRWDRFLHEVFGGDNELISYVHRACGYSLTGDMREQCFFVNLGIGGNGKSTFLETLLHVFGDYSHNAAFSTFEYAKSPSIPVDVACLHSKRFVTASETNQGMRLNEARLKRIAGGDDLTARFMRENLFEFTPVCKIWLAVNYKPKVVDDADGFWRKVRLIPFNQQFSGDKDDKQLRETLRTEAPGILAWAVRGALEWKEKGLGSAQAIASATKDYKSQNDPLAEFIEDICITDSEIKVSKRELLGAYLNWCNRERIPTKDRIGRNMFYSKVGIMFKESRDSGCRFFNGIGIKG